MFQMFTSSHHLKIFRSIIGFVSVDVMDNFTDVQKSAEYLFSNYPMFKNISLFIRKRVIWFQKHYITIPKLLLSAPPSRVKFTRVLRVFHSSLRTNPASFAPTVNTGAGTKLLSCFPLVKADCSFLLKDFTAKKTGFSMHSLIINNRYVNSIVWE